VKLAVFQHVFDELRILERFAVLDLDHSIQQSHLRKPGEHFIDGVVDGIVGVDERPVPIKEQYFRCCARESQDAHSRREVVRSL
jgi:hypothetical protein